MKALHPVIGTEWGSSSIPKSSGPGSCRQNRPSIRQHFLKRLPEPQGQRSFRPSFSSSTLSQLTICTPRLTCVSDGKPRRRLLIGSKKWLVFGSHGTPPGALVHRPRHPGRQRVHCHRADQD